VLFHTSQKLITGTEKYGINASYIYDISKASTSLQHILLIIIQYFGVWGNDIFFVCSAWFLLDNNRFKKKKEFFLFSEVWIISIIMLIAGLIVLHGDISTKNILKSIFPNTLGLNWYITCYLLFYPIHPILNKIILWMNQKTLLRTTIALSLLYIFINTIKEDLFFSSPLILWCAFYFLIAYLKFYLIDFSNNIKKNVWLFGANLIGILALIFATNVLGLHSSFFNDKDLHWAVNCNFFIIFMTIAMFNISRSIHFNNKFINYLSSLSLLVYIIHENLIMRRYIRPATWDFMYRQSGHGHLIGQLMIIFISTLIGTFIVSWIYDKTLRKLVRKGSLWIYKKLRVKYLNVERKILNNWK
jgi:hypothetical protein